MRWIESPKLQGRRASLFILPRCTATSSPFKVRQGAPLEPRWKGNSLRTSWNTPLSRAGPRNSKKPDVANKTPRKSHTPDTINGRVSIAHEGQNDEFAWTARRQAE